MTQFITNKDRKLSEVISRIMPGCDKLCFLVGYFYFSGFEAIYRDLRDKKIRILVGLEIDRDASGHLREFEVLESASSARGARKKAFYESLVTLFNSSRYFDSREKQEAFRLFLEKIRDGSLEIRKTQEHNHAKLYIFENKPEHQQGGEYPGTVITGSSNLTHSGLEGRFEINKDFRDKAHFDEAMFLFDGLWKDAIALADAETRDQFLTDVIERIWIDKFPRPFLLYIRVLEEYFSVPKVAALRMPADLSNGEFMNLKYQTDAIRQTIDVLCRHNGVILADVVGLGKSIIASAAARNLDLNVIVIAPPHLLPQWEEYRYRFGFNARIYSSGKIEQAISENADFSDSLIIIDEAHKYRNELTQDYALLHQLCQRNKVMLLTATPFNNSPEDVFSLVKLFQIPTRSTLLTVQNLSWEFKRLIEEYQAIRNAQRKGTEGREAIKTRIRKVAEEIRGMLAPLVIRRSRLDLDAIEDYRRDLKEQGISFPKVRDPELLEYELGPLSALYEKTLRDIAPEDEHEGFIGARYQPVTYLKDVKAFLKRVSSDFAVDENLLLGIQINLAKFMRKLLVRRFESSVHAFRLTLDSLIRSSELAKEWYERLREVPIYKKGGLPDIADIEDAMGEDLPEKLKETFLDDYLASYRKEGLVLIRRDELTPDYVRHLEHDIELLKGIREHWSKLENKKDPKLDHFSEIVSRQLKDEPNRKIVVFTEFADTANYLFDSLKGKIKAFKYSAQDASDAAKRTLRENFDAGWSIQKDEYQVLIATDAISEGFNLHRAGTVFNYDIPWNPTRVIQRVGRINRVNKKVFQELYIYNFFPTVTGERETGVRQVSTLKMAMIHALFGEDTRFLTRDEEIQPWLAGQFKVRNEAEEELSPEAPYENIIRRLRASDPGLIEEARRVPKRVRIRRTLGKGKTGILVFARKGGEFAFKLQETNVSLGNLPPAEAFNLFEADATEGASPVSSSFHASFERLVPVLFSTKTEVAMDRGAVKTLDMIRLLQQKTSLSKDYLADLLYVLQDLDALPERHAKAIRAIDASRPDAAIVELTKEIPHSYLLDIIAREKSIAEGAEDIILAEELP